MKYKICGCILIWISFACGSGAEQQQGETLDIRQVQQPRTFIGELIMSEDGDEFLECQTQAAYPVVGGEGLVLMKKTYLSMGLGGESTVLAEFEGYIAQQVRIDSEESDLVLMVNKFINLNPVQNCSDVSIRVTEDSLFIQIAGELENISYMYQDSVIRATSIEPGMRLDKILTSEPMEIAFQAYLMARGKLSRRQVMEQEDSLQTVMDVYELLKRE